MFSSDLSLTRVIPSLDIILRRCFPLWGQLGTNPELWIPLEQESCLWHLVLRLKCSRSAAFGWTGGHPGVSASVYTTGQPSPSFQINFIAKSHQAGSFLKMFRAAFWHFPSMQSEELTAWHKTSVVTNGPSCRGQTWRQIKATASATHRCPTFLFHPV